MNANSFLPPSDLTQINGEEYKFKLQFELKKSTLVNTSTTISTAYRQDAFCAVPTQKIINLNVVMDRFQDRRHPS
jgi:hypothetical protein